MASMKPRIFHAAVALLALAVSFHAAGLLNGTDAPRAGLEAHAVENRLIVFRDGGAGDIFAFDVNAEKPFAVLKRDNNQFLASAVRLLATERVRRGAGGREAPFRLTRWSDGRVSFSDPETGETVELSAFGPTNVRSFVQLLRENSKS